MIHVDLSGEKREDRYTLAVSMDGGRFVEHWHLSAGLDEFQAKADARMYASGILFGVQTTELPSTHQEVKLTCFGEDVYIPDMTTVRV